MRTTGEVLHANFGQEPFLFDFEGYIETQTNKTKERILATSLPQTSSTTLQLVIDYLLHNSHLKTAQKLLESALVEDINPRLIEIAEKRKSVNTLIKDGKYDEALLKIEQLYPGLLEKEQKVLYYIKAQKFVEMINSRHPLEQTIAFGQRELAPPSDPGLEKLSQEIYSLLAYADPSASPVAYLLDPQRRNDLADAANVMLLAQEQLPRFPALEQLLRQTNLALTELSQTTPPTLINIQINDIV
eukprot:TRINITY_DN1095_c0_g1_i2.p1 TRINITY_DN1095_c0_g1~~TRINITY_DN1095_c0_g1_i2.p1  ORF type:complete len:244 (-),score=58.59 TRINITY_DN1095_c0_g1_i2:335-1066(-)